MFRIFGSQTAVRQKKHARFWQISIIIRYIIIICCLIMLPLDEFLYDVVDDFTPAYPSNATTPKPQPQTTPNSAPTTSTPNSGPTTSTPKPPNATRDAVNATYHVTGSSDHSSSVSAPSSNATTTNSPKRTFIPLSKTAGKDFISIIKLSEWSGLPPAFRVERAMDPLTLEKNTKTRLSDLLILYPCCTTILIILGMEMCGQKLLDPMTKWTNLFLIILCIGLSTVALIVSLLAAVRTVQVIMIVLAVLLASFLLLETVDLCLL